MFLEQVQGQHARDGFSTDTESKLTLVLVVKTARSILILLKVEDAGVHKAVERHESRDNAINDELGGVVDHSFAPADRQTQAHAVTFLQKLDSVALGHGANTELVNDSLVFNQDLIEVKLILDRLELLVVGLEDGLVLHGALVKFLLNALLSDSLVGAVVQLGDHNVVHLIVLVVSQHIEDLYNLALALSDLLHKGTAHLAVLNLHRGLDVHVGLAIEGLQVLVALLASVGLLNGLDQVEDLLVGVLEASLQLNVFAGALDLLAGDLVLLGLVFEEKRSGEAFNILGLHDGLAREGHTRNHGHTLDFLVAELIIGLERVSIVKLESIGQLQLDGSLALHSHVERFRQALLDLFSIVGLLGVNIEKVSHFSATLRNPVHELSVVARRKSNRQEAGLDRV